MKRAWNDANFRQRLNGRRIGNTRRGKGMFFAKLVEATTICMAYLIAFSYVIFTVWLALVLSGALYRIIFSWWR